MTYIPRITKDREDSLCKENREFLRGYDWCLNNDVLTFFDNLDIYYDDLELEDCDINIGRFLDKRPNVKEALIDCLKDYIASNRNMLVVSMVDNEAKPEW